MKKTWRNIIIVFWILIALEGTAAFIVLNPYFKIQRLFEGVEAGNWQVTQENYDNLNYSQQQKVQGYLDDYAIHLCEQYLKEKVTYEQIAASFDAINSIDETGKIMITYMPDVTYNEFKKDIKGIEDANRAFDSNKAFELSKQLRAVRLRIDNTSKEQALMEMLNETYVKYLNEEMTSEQALAFAETLAGMSYTDAAEYITVISNNIACVEEYRQIYADAQAAFDDEDYFKAIELLELATPDSHDTKYLASFENLHEEAYSTGKTYYTDLLNEYVQTGMKVEAVSLMEKISECYGDEIDLTSVKQDMADEWQLAYIDRMLDEEARKNDLSGFETGRYILERYDRLKPDSVVLHDIDGNGIPEMFLFSSKDVGNDYIGCYIYTYREGECKFVNYVNVKSFCRDSYLIGYPIAFSRDGGDEDSLVQYDGANLTQISYVQKIGETYYVNGEETDDVDYLSERTTILAHADAYNVGNSKSASIEEGEGFILAY